VRLWASHAVSRLGSQITLLAVPLTAVVLGAGAREMGWLAAAQSLPVLLLGLVAGTWVDRLPRRPLLIAADIARAALLSSIPAAALFGQLRLELLYAVAFLAGALAVVSEVAHAAYLPALVGREHLVEGNSKLAVAGQAASVAGPSLGGVLVGLVTAPMAVFADVASFVASALLLGAIRRPEPAPAGSARRQALWREIGEGLRFLAAHPVLRTLTGAFGFYFLFDALFWGLYPLYVTQELGVSAPMLGLIFAVGSVGGVLGALFVEPVTRRFGLGPTLAGALLVGALGELCIPLAGGPVLVATAVLALGEVLVRSSDWVFEVNFASLRQGLTPDRLRGRVHATVRVFTAGLVPVGAFAGGLLGEAIGLRPTVLIGAAGVLLAFLWVVLSPVRSLRSLPEAPVPTEPGPPDDAPDGAPSGAKPSVHGTAWVPHDLI
jgi:MFS family permease